MPATSQYLLTTKQVATRLCVSESWLEKLRCYGRGPVYYKMLGKVVYKQSEVDTWFESFRVDGGADHE